MPLVAVSGQVGALFDGMSLVLRARGVVVDCSQGSEGLLRLHSPDAKMNDRRPRRCL
jgi:hypothetical protein